VLSDEELKAIWVSCLSPAAPARDDATLGQNVPELPKAYRDIVKLLILTGQRRGEIAALRTSLVDGPVVRLPSALTKNHREHVFPLPALAADILRKMGGRHDAKR
jgi:integrase